MKLEKKFSIVKPHFRFHFRKHLTKKGNKNHPALIVGSNDKEYAYKSLTHSKKSGKRNNKKLFKNPKKNDSKEAYLVKILKSDKKNKFSKKEIKNLKLDLKDENEILEMLKKNKHFN